jgi:hypothetical protein
VRRNSAAPGSRRAAVSGDDRAPNLAQACRAICVREAEAPDPCIRRRRHSPNNLIEMKAADALAQPGKTGVNGLLQVVSNLRDFGGFGPDFQSAGPQDWSNNTSFDFRSMPSAAATR